MKKMFFCLALFFAISAGVSAQEVTATRYWYYPSQNVYYNNASGEYWYYDEPTTHWMTVKTLPTTYVLTDNTPHYDVYYKGTDVWKENKAHRMKYKENKKGVTKVKPDR